MLQKYKKELVYFLSIVENEGCLTYICFGSSRVLSYMALFFEMKYF